MAEYFSHDSNARNDDRIIAVRMKYGIEGYGIYFAILERMRDSSNYMCAVDYNVIAYDLRVDAAKIKSIVNDFGLFVFTEDRKYFYSESFLNRMKKKDEKSEKARESASNRWRKDDESCERNANAMRTDSECNAIKESKVKKSKERNIIVEKIYSIYPSKCVVKNSSTGKCTKDKQKIEKILESVSEEKIIATIEWYVKDCKENNRYMKNFSTFLNNLPEIPNEKEQEAGNRICEWQLLFDGSIRKSTWEQYQTDISRYGIDNVKFICYAD